MINLLFLLVVNAFVVYGVYAVTEYCLCTVKDIEGKPIKKIDRENSNILWFMAYYGDKLLPYWITKPLYNCPVCMSSIWGLWYWLFHPQEVTQIKYWIFYTLALAGVCWLIGIIWEQKEIRSLKKL